MMVDNGEGDDMMGMLMGVVVVWYLCLVIVIVVEW